MQSRGGPEPVWPAEAEASADGGGEEERVICLGGEMLQGHESEGILPYRGSRNPFSQFSKKLWSRRSQVRIWGDFMVCDFKQWSRRFNPGGFV